MQDIYVGMFVEKNKDRLLENDLSHAVIALQKAEDPDRFLSAKTKNPCTTKFLSATLGWLGIDKLYLGMYAQFFLQILFIGICVGLGLLCDYTINSLNTPINIGTIDNIGTIELSIKLLQSASFIITGIVYIIFIIAMSINTANASFLTKKRNAQILNIVNLFEIKKIDHWNIG